MRKDILPYYRALGLNPGAGPLEIRRAYRQLVQRWHPDLYKPGSPMQTTAEDITKEINEAYGQLYRKKLYRHFPPKEEQSAPPAEEASRPSPVATSRRPAPWAARKGTTEPTYGRSRAAKASRSAGQSYAQWEERVLRGLMSRRAKVVLALAAVVTAIPLCWVLWSSMPAFSRPRLTPEIAPTAVTPQPDQRIPAAVTPSAPSTLNYRPEPVGESLTAKRLENLFQLTQSLVDRVPAAEAPNRDALAESDGLILDLFEMGDSKSKVLSLQGSPDETGDTVFRYGSSLIYFRDGRVRGWVDRLPHLRVRSWGSGFAPSLDSFSTGSSRNEVVRAQGTPGAYTRDTYFYGSSAVFFAHDRVSGWTEGGEPLHAFDLPQLPFREFRGNGSGRPQ